MNNFLNLYVLFLQFAKNTEFYFNILQDNIKIHTIQLIFRMCTFNKNMKNNNCYYGSKKVLTNNITTLKHST